MEKIVTDAAPPARAAFFAFINNPIRAKLYLLKNLPAAFFSGLKIVEANEISCSVSVPYKWFTRTPFRSTYFACLSMAAELSTGILAMANIFKRKPPVSMLITGIEGKFYKKAKKHTIFQCTEGEAISNIVIATIRSGQPKQIKVLSTGRNELDELIAEFYVTWSFKMK